jgi:lactoylglutathione lyase
LQTGGSIAISANWSGTEQTQVLLSLIVPGLRQLGDLDVQTCACEMFKNPLPSEQSGCDFSRAHGETICQHGQEEGTMKVCFTTITVKDMAQSLRFYKDIIGLVELSRQTEQVGDQKVNISFLKDPRDAESGLIELIEYSSWIGDGEGNKNFHRPTMLVCFKVDDLNATLEVIRENQIEIIRGPFEAAGGQMRMIFLKDPNDAVIELVEGFDLAKFPKPPSL